MTSRRRPPSSSEREREPVSIGSGIGRRAARVMFVLFLDDSVVAFFLYLCCLSGRTCVSLKEIAMIACNDDEPPPRGLRGRVADSSIYIRLNYYRQRRERALVRGRAAVDDTVHASRDRSRTAQGPHQRWSHLRVPRYIRQLCST